MVKKAILRYFLSFLPEKINFTPELSQEIQSLLKKALMAEIKNFWKILARKLTKISFRKVSTQKLTKISF